MADEYVVIKIKVNADTKEIKRVNRELAELGVQARMVDKSSTDLSKALNTKLDPAVKKFRKRIGELIEGLAKFNKLSLKVFGISFVVAAASLASVNALFATGRFLVQAYRVTMQALAVGVTAVGAALSVVAAAQREYNAALYAYSYKASAGLEGGLNKSRSALRMLQRDSTLAIFGMEALDASFASLSKSGQVTAKTVDALRFFADFAAAGGDPGKNLQGVAEVLAIIQKKGKVTQDAIVAAKNVNDQFYKAIRKSGGKSFDELIGFMEKANIKAASGVQGQAALVGSTIMGQFKALIPQFFALFADIGQPLLGPVEKTLSKITKIFRGGILRLAPSFIEFGSGRFLEGITNMVQKLTDAFINLERKYLGQSEGMLKRFTGWWSKVEYWFGKVTDSMRPLLDGGRVIIDAFGPVFGELFGGVGGIIKNLDRLVTKNKDKWIEFGKAVANAVKLVGEYISMMFDVFDRALPIITPLINAVADLARAIMMIPKALSAIPKNFGALGALLSMFGFIIAGKSTKNWAKGKGFTPRPGLASGVGGSRVGRPDIFSPISSMGTLIYGGGQMGRGSGGPVYGPQAPLKHRMRNAFNGNISMSTGMLAAAGFGLLAPYVNQDAGGYVAGASLLSGLAPLMGPDGKYGKYGLGAAGALAGYGIMSNAQTGAGGAMGGAMTGASIGGMFGPLGMAAGAAVGGIIGFFKGRTNKKKKEVTLAAKKASGELYNDMASAMITGNVRRAEEIRKRELKRLEGKDLTPEEVKLLKKSPAAFINEMDTRKKTLEAMQGPLERFSAITKSISTITGKTTDEIQKLANELGVNLYDDTQNAVDVMRQLGVAFTMTAEQIKQSLFDLAVDALSVFDKPLERMQATSIVDDIVQAMKDAVSSGAVDEMGVTQSLRDLYEQRLILNPDSPIGIVTEMLQEFSKGGTAYGPDGIFSGLSQAGIDLFTGFADPLMQELTKTLKTVMLPSMAATVAGIFAEHNYEVSASQLTSQLGNLSPDKLAKLEQILIKSTNYENLDSETRRMYERRNIPMATSSTEYIAQELSRQLGITLPYTAIDIATKTGLTEEEANARKEFFDVVTNAFTNAPGWMDDTPPWWETPPAFMRDSSWPPNSGNSVLDNSNYKGSADNQERELKNQNTWPPADTASSRLSTTLARHRQLNSRIAGNRSITSSFRTNNLGSINSDHVTGRAYDLIGQNLGAYSRLVNASGGFSEFHGYGGSRHLHVVPGEGPIGDTTLPSVTSSNPLSTAATTNNSYSIVVNGGGDSAEKIARTVMDEIVRQQRSARERR